jgi:hypothetical protein
VWVDWKADIYQKLFVMEFNVSDVSHAILTLLQFFTADLSVKVSTMNAGEMALTR